MAVHVDMKGNAMNLILTPMFASFFYIGGASLGVLVLIVVVVLLLRR